MSHGHARTSVKTHQASERNTSYTLCGKQLNSYLISWIPSNGAREHVTCRNCLKSRDAADRYKAALASVGAA